MDCPCGVRLHVNSYRVGIFECKQCNRRTREAKRLGTYIATLLLAALGIA